MSLVAAHDLTKAFGTRSVLDGVTLTIEPGERVGLVGGNGSGKSTLARILAGLDAPDGGTVARRREAPIGYLQQDPRFDGELSARAVVLAGLGAWSVAKARHDQASAALAGAASNALAGLLEEQEKAAADVERLGGWDREHQALAMLAAVGVSRPDAPFATLSGGDKRRVALARVLVARPALAILDEPSNHLDLESLEWLEGYLRDDHPGAVLLVTHDRWLLDGVVTRTLELAHGKLYSYDGGYQDYLEEKLTREDHEARTEQNRQNFLRREVEWLRRQPKARSTKQKARIDRAQVALSQLAPKQERTAKLAMDSVRGGRNALEISGLRVDVAGRTLVSGLDLIVAPGERLGVVGRNGSGKTSLLRVIKGELAPAAGEVVLGRGTRLSYFDQHRADLDDAASIFDNVAQNRARVELGGESVEVRSYLERYLFDPHRQRQPVGSLSGGERARVALAKLLSEPASLVLLDEPTNDLDVPTLTVLEQVLVDFRGAVVVVTHDRWFLDRVATGVIAFEGDGKVVRYAGGYTSFRQQQAASAALTTAAPAARKQARSEAPPPLAPAAAAAAPAGLKPLSWAEKRELEGLLEKIEQAETAAAALEAELADPTLYASRGDAVPRLTARLRDARTEAERLTARWEELEMRSAAK
jgi:ABC transport system ATP-binding/permease protein